MKILVVFTGDVNKGRGTPIRVKNCVSYFSKKHEVVLLSSSKKLEFSHDKKRLRLITLKSTSTLSAYHIHKEEILSEKPDIIFIPTFNSFYLGFLFGRKLNIRTVLEVHSLLSHNLMFNESYSPLHPLVWYYFILERMVSLFADALIPVSEGLKKKLSLYNSNSLTIRGGVDREAFEKAKEHKEIKKLKRKHKDTLFVMYAGNFSKYQGVFQLFKAIEILNKKNENFFFLFVGNHTTLKKETFERIKKMKNVYFLGQKANSEMPSYLKGADILVVPRINSPINKYSYPSKLTEYLACSKAVLSTSVGDIPYVIEDGKSGLLTEPGSVQALVDALLRLKNKDLRRGLGREGYKKVKENYTWDVLTEKILIFCERLRKK